jgi:hypothetical protein
MELGRRKMNSWQCNVLVQEGRAALMKGIWGRRACPNLVFHGDGSGRDALSRAVQDDFPLLRRQVLPPIRDCTGGQVSQLYLSIIPVPRNARTVASPAHHINMPQ